MDIKNITKVVVHSGIMHADDVFTVAYIQLMKKALGQEPVQVIREFKIGLGQTLKNGYLVADIGGGRYDHHCKEEHKERRPNGSAYASFGLVVRDFHKGFLTEDEYELFDKKFIEPLDWYDNNGSSNQLAAVIYSFNKPWDDNTPGTDFRFFSAVKLAMTILEQYISSIRALARAKSLALSSKVDGETIYLDRYAPVSEFVSGNPDINFIGAPSLRGGYQIVAVKNPKGENKKLLPESIRGLSFGQFEYNDEGLNFCHSSGFMATFRDKEAAREYMNSLFENKQSTDE